MLKYEEMISHYKQLRENEPNLLKHINVVAKHN